MYPSIVYLHIVANFIFLVQDAAETWVTLRIRGQKEPEGIFATYAFIPDNIVRNLRITYWPIVITGITAGLSARSGGRLGCGRHFP